MYDFSIGVAADLYYRENIIALIGPACAYALDGVARMAAFWNIPIITGKAILYLFTVDILTKANKQRSKQGSKHVCMYVLMYVCMHVYMYVCMHVYIYVLMYVCINVCVKVKFVLFNDATGTH